MVDKISSQTYKKWINELKEQFQKSQIKASIKVNSTLLEFYWDLGSEIVEKQKEYNWGSGFLEQLSQDLSKEFPDVKGFSVTNISYIRRWVLFYTQNNIATSCGENEIIKSPQFVAELFMIPWGHNRVIISKCKTIDEALYYVRNTIKNGISRNVLIHQIETNLYKRDAKAITNFEATLPPIQSDLAKEITKDPYNFDFLTLTENYQEKELEELIVK